MSLPRINNTTDLSTLTNRAELIQLTAAQIIKDFDLFGITINFSGNADTAYKELHMQLTPILANSYKTNSENFSNLLYRIDIKEKKLAELSRENYFEELAQMIIFRELEKVIIRKYYAAGGKL